MEGRNEKKSRSPVRIEITDTSLLPENFRRNPPIPRTMLPHRRSMERSHKDTVNSERIASRKANERAREAQTHIHTKRERENKAGVKRKGAVA